MNALKCMFKVCEHLKLPCSSEVRQGECLAPHSFKIIIVTSNPVRYFVGILVSGYFCDNLYMNSEILHMYIFLCDCCDRLNLCYFTLVCRNKSPTGLMFIVHNIRRKINFKYLCLYDMFSIRLFVFIITNKSGFIATLIDCKYSYHYSNNGTNCDQTVRIIRI